MVLDTETTGLSPNEGHRVIEIGVVELCNLNPTGRSYHAYLDPEREIPEESIRIHGITNARVAGCPKFWEIADDFLGFLEGMPLVIHNAPFDLGFLNHELQQCGKSPSPLTDYEVVDTLIEARRRHPRQRNNLDALCRRYGVDNTQRTVHGALLDATILAEVFVAMLGGHQTVLDGLGERWGGVQRTARGAAETPLAEACGLIPVDARLPTGRRSRVVQASPEELDAHGALLKRLGEACIWDAASEPV